VDAAFIPRRAHLAFARGTAALWDVQCEVALPTLFQSFSETGVAQHKPLQCAGGCCQKIPWGSVRPSQLCAHRVDLEHAHNSGIPPRLHPPQCGGEAGGTGAAGALVAPRNARWMASGGRTSVGWRTAKGAGGGGAKGAGGGGGGAPRHRPTGGFFG